MPYLAIMQGRLVPPEGGNARYFPRQRWQDEFALAARAGLNGIEWIYDKYGEDTNPLASDTGVAHMLELAKESGISVHSLCANYVMDCAPFRAPALSRSELILKLEWLLSRCRKARIRRVVLPLLDEARIETEPEVADAIAILRRLSPTAQENGVEIHLELSLAPQAIARLLDDCGDPLLRITYDSGNSASLGFDVGEELATYGDRIGSVHIKDRLLGGSSVPPGTGDADFSRLFGELRRLSYAGEFVMELARPEPGQELPYITKCRHWLEEQIPSKHEVRELQ